MVLYGLLPDPNTSILHSPNIEDYVKRSNFPIPYQAAEIIESCNVNKSPTWDINVNNKNINLKLQWNLSSDNKANQLELFPKAVLKIISTYHTKDPKWNISYNNKLCLNVDWKIDSVLNQSQSHDNSLNSSHMMTQNSMNSSYKPQVPFNSTPVTPAYSNSYRNQPDSGYKSFESPLNFTNNGNNTSRRTNVNKTPYSSAPRSKLFQTPFKSPHNQDLYRPKLINPSTSNSYTNHDRKPSPKHSQKSIHTGEIDNINNTQSSRVTDARAEMSEKGEIITTTDTPADIPSTNVVTCQSPSSDIPLAVKTESVSVASHSDVTSQVPSRTISTTPPESVILDENPDENTDENYEFDPAKEIFYPIPDDLPIDDDGYLDSDVEAEFMNIPGACRLCGESVPSYQSSKHLLQCPGLDLEPRHEFVDQFSDKLFSLPEIIVPILWDYMDYNYSEAKVPNDTFKTIEQYREFTKGIDDLRDNLTVQFFETIDHPKSNFINILNFKDTHLY